MPPPNNPLDFQVSGFIGTWDSYENSLDATDLAFAFDQFKFKSKDGEEVTLQEMIDLKGQVRELQKEVAILKAIKRVLGEEKFAQVLEAIEDDIA